MYCKYCGKKLDDEFISCPYCGASLNSSTSQRQNNRMYYNEPQMVDDGSVGWAFLGFFIPIAGLVLYLVWKNEKPRCAKMAGKGALISFIIYLCFIVFYILFYGLILARFMF